MYRCPIIRFSGMLVVSVLWAHSLAAEDWTQWMGSDRDNHWKESGIVDRFSDDGPRVLWRTPIAGGYAGPAVADGRVFLTDYVTAENVQIANFERESFSGIERVLCLNESTGEVLWKHEYPVKYTVSYPAGPRCTPTIDGGRVYTLGTEGDLFCLRVDTGEVIWSKNLPADYATKTAIWGYASHPLVDGDKLICVAGGSGSHTVALDKRTGEEIWRALSSPEQGYSPPTIVTAGGVRQLIVTRPDAISGLDPETGREYWTTPYEADNGSIIMSPIIVGAYLYVGGFSNRNLLLELASDRPAVEVLWRDEHRRGISPVNVQPTVDGMMMYGFDQRGTLMGVELPSGERLWETAEPIGERPAGTDTAFIVRHGDRYFLFTEKGDLIIARLTRDGYEEIDRMHVLEPTGVAVGRKVLWSPPAYANRHLYARNDKEIIAVDLARP